MRFIHSSTRFLLVRVTKYVETRIESKTERKKKKKIQVDRMDSIVGNLFIVKIALYLYEERGGLGSAFRCAPGSVLLILGINHDKCRISILDTGSQKVLHGYWDGTAQSLGWIDDHLKLVK